MVRGNVKMGDVKYEKFGGKGESKVMLHIAFTSAPPIPKKYNKNAKGKETAIEIATFFKSTPSTASSKIPMPPIMSQSLSLASLYFKSL